jgi:hypothetical protein
MGHPANLPIYTMEMKITVTLDDPLAARACQKAEALGVSLDQLVSDCLISIVNEDDAERSVEEFRRLSGQGNSPGLRFDRDEIHERG